MQLKKVMASLGVLLCLCSSSAVAYADTTVPFANDGISLVYEIASNPISDLDIENHTAYCTSTVGGGSTAVSITVTQTLQKHRGLWNWDNVKGAEWTRTVDRNSINLSNSKSNLDSGKYRVKSVFTLTDKNGKSETITIYSDEQSVP